MTNFISNNEIFFQIFVRIHNGKIQPFDVVARETVKAVKRKISTKFGIPVCEQRLMFAAKQLEDAKCLSDYCIQRESSLQLLLRLPGGQSVEIKDLTCSPSSCFY
uniref:Ubiquitin-like domain-containing protein n=1 Tax=Panagrolaimus sp. ES5 TaxID=591445 RepID=A0AC34FZ51_9BILA